MSKLNNLIETLKKTEVSEYKSVKELELAVEIIKELEILKIFLKHSFVSDEYEYNDKAQLIIYLMIPEEDKDFKVIKEWLENVID